MDCENKSVSVHFINICLSYIFLQCVELIVIDDAFSAKGNFFRP